MFSLTLVDGRVLVKYAYINFQICESGYLE